MADGLNRWTGIGNLCADPELRTTQGGQTVLNMRMACNESYLDRNRQRQERVEYVSVTVWGNRADALSKILSKGFRLYAEGRLHTSSYDDRDGNKRWKTEVVANKIILADGRRGGQQQQHPQQDNYGTATSGEYPDDDPQF